jgi:hypothetical protein
MYLFWYFQMHLELHTWFVETQNTNKMFWEIIEIEVTILMIMHVTQNKKKQLSFINVGGEMQYMYIKTNIICMHTLL